MSASTIEVLGTVFFVLAVVHTFITSKFKELGSRFREGSVKENLFHLLGEVEIVFGLWAGVFCVTAIVLSDSASVISFLEGLSYGEPIFVFVVMVIAATRPVLRVAEFLTLRLGRVLPLPGDMGPFIATLFVGPLLGSFITEPAAMTVTALALRDRFYNRKISEKFKYITLGTLFVNVSIGGVLTPYAAPPVVMVAGKWGWDLGFMLAHFGKDAIIAVLLNTILAAYLLRKELKGMASPEGASAKTPRLPYWVTGLHLVFLAAVVMVAHHPVVFLGLFLFFMGLVAVTKEYQDDLKLKEGLLVGFFLAGLVVLGSQQTWWLKPVLAGMSDFTLYLGAAFLTSFTDNAALTYLGSQVENLADSAKFALVAGAIVGGGMTVIANAPNPAGFSILQDKFGKGGISALKLAAAAIVPTLIALMCFWFLH